MCARTLPNIPENGVAIAAAAGARSSDLSVITTICESTLVVAARAPKMHVHALRTGANSARKFQRLQYYTV